MQTVLERYKITILVDKSNWYSQEKSVQKILQYVIGNGNEDLLKPNLSLDLEKKFIEIMKQPFP